MVADFSVKNNTYSSGQRNQDTLRRLAKEIFEKAEKKERKVEHIIEPREDYTTTTYIPAETYIYNISSRAFVNNDLQKTLNFLNNKAAIKSFAKESVIKDSASDDIFEFTPDETKNIFAA